MNGDGLEDQVARVKEEMVRDSDSDEDTQDVHLPVNMPIARQYSSLLNVNNFSNQANNFSSVNNPQQSPKVPSPNRNFNAVSSSSASSSKSLNSQQQQQQQQQQLNRKSARVRNTQEQSAALQNLRAFQLDDNDAADDDDDASMNLEDDMGLASKRPQIQQQQQHKPRMRDIEPGSVLDRFVSFISADESLQRELKQDFADDHWTNLRQKYTQYSSCRKGRWSEMESTLIRRYVNRSRYYKTVDSNFNGPNADIRVLNVNYLKHCLALVMSRSLKSVESEWIKQFPQEKMGENFADSFSSLKTVFDNKQQQQQLFDSSMEQMFSQIKQCMQLYTEAVVKANVQQQVVSPQHWKDVSTFIISHLQKLNTLKDAQNEQLFEYLWKCTFEQHQGINNSNGISSSSSGGLFQGGMGNNSSSNMSAVSSGLVVQQQQQVAPLLSSLPIGGAAPSYSKKQEQQQGSLLFPPSAQQLQHQIQQAQQQHQQYQQQQQQQPFSSPFLQQNFHKSISLPPPPLAQQNLL